MEDNISYFLACVYMTYTEEYDRFLSNIRSKHDPTEAIVDCRCKKYSDRYAINCRKYLYKLYPQFKKAWNEEIRKHNNYSAQHWIDEYERLTCDGWKLIDQSEPKEIDSEIAYIKRPDWCVLE